MLGKSRSFYFFFLLLPDWTLCANEGNECYCDGAILYGRRYASGEPGSGVKATIDDMYKSAHKLVKSTGLISCDYVTLGGDPLPLVYKHCLCGPRRAVKT